MRVGDDGEQGGGGKEERWADAGRGEELDSHDPVSDRPSEDRDGSSLSSHEEGEDLGGIQPEREESRSRSATTRATFAPCPHATHQGTVNHVAPNVEV